MFDCGLRRGELDGHERLWPFVCEAKYMGGGTPAGICAYLQLFSGKATGLLLHRLEGSPRHVHVRKGRQHSVRPGARPRAPAIISLEYMVRTMWPH